MGLVQLKMFMNRRKLIKTELDFYCTTAAGVCVCVFMTREDEDVIFLNSFFVIGEGSSVGVKYEGLGFERMPRR